MVGWHHLLNGREFEQTPRDSERQEILVCGSTWGHKELDKTQRLNQKHQFMEDTVIRPTKDSEYNR